MTGDPTLKEAFEPSVLASLLLRHQSFWHCGDVDRPLVGWSRWPLNPVLDFDWGFPEGEGELLPDMIVVDRLLPQFEAYFAKGSGPLDGDLIWPCTPPRAMPWLEAILGSPVHFANSSNSKGIFAERFVPDLSRLPQIPPLQDNAWFLKLTELVRGLVHLSGGRFPLAAPQLRGPWDVLSTARGMANLFLDLYDAPEVIMSYAERCAHLWIEATRHLETLIPTWHGGHVGFFGLWAPEYSPMSQDDTSISVSARQYAEVMLPADRMTALPWPYQLFHTHSGGAHLLETMLGFLEGGRGVNVVLDPNGPSLPELLPTLQRVQERRVPLYIAAYSWTDVEFLTSRLSPCGLALSCSLEGGVGR